MNFDKNVKKSSSSKIESGVLGVSGAIFLLVFAKKAKNHVLGMAFLKCLSRVKQIVDKLKAK